MPRCYICGKDRALPDNYGNKKICHQCKTEIQRGKLVIGDLSTTFLLDLINEELNSISGYTRERKNFTIGDILKNLLDEYSAIIGDIGSIKKVINESIITTFKNINMIRNTKPLPDGAVG